MAGTSISAVIRKYSVVVFFPTFTVATIYADWSHTRRWKREQQLLKPENKEISQ